MAAATAETWVALLRAVNLGPRNRVPMADLRSVLERAGYREVRTYIASGNVLFADAGQAEAALRSELERLVEESFGVRTTVVLRTGAVLGALIESHPFGEDTSRSHVTFLAAEPAPDAVERLQGLDVAPDAFHLIGRDVLLHYPNGVQGSRLTSALLERELGTPGTNRTWKTVTRLAELAAAPP